MLPPTNQRKQVVMRIMLSTVLAVVACGYWWNRHKIQGFGNYKLGEKAPFAMGFKPTSFMFFQEQGWVATDKSLKKYSTYYLRKYSDTVFGGPLRFYAPLSMEKRKDIDDNISWLIKNLEEKYRSCSVRRYGAKEKHEDWIVIYLLSGYDCSGNLLPTVVQDALRNNWHRIFEVTEEDRRIGVFVTDDEGANSDGIHNVSVVVAAWDNSLYKLALKETKKLMLDSL